MKPAEPPARKGQSHANCFLFFLAKMNRFLLNAAVEPAEPSDLKGQPHENSFSFFLIQMNWC